MATGNVIGNGTINVNANMSNFTNALNALPAQARAKISAVLNAIQAEMARKKLEIKMAGNDPNLARRSAELQRLTGEYDRLRDKASLIEQVAIRNATALQAEARAHRAAELAAAAHASAAAQAANAGSGPSTGTHGGGGSGGVGAAAANATAAAAASVKANRAMLLMNISQMADDIQYGFRSIVNNIPMFSTSLLGAFGVTGQAAMAWSSGIGIAAVAVNQLINHWDDLKAALGIPIIQTEAEKMEALAKATEHTARETQKLLALERQKSTIKQQEGAQTDQQKQQADIVNEAFRNAGYADVHKTARNMLEQRIVNSMPALGGVDPDGNEKTLKSERDRMAKRYRRSAAGQEVIEGHGIWQTNDHLTTTEQHKKNAEEAERKYQAYIDEQVSKYLADVANDPEKLGAFLKNLGKSEHTEKLRGDLTMALPQNLESRQDRIKQKQIEDEGKEEKAKDQAAVKLAGPFKDRIQRSMLTNKDDVFAGEAEKANIAAKLKDAGKSAEDIEDLVPRIIKNIKKDLEAAVKERMIERNVSGDEARSQILTEMKQKEENAAKSIEEAKRLEKEKAAGIVKLGMSQPESSRTFSDGRSLANSFIKTSLNGNRESDMQEKIRKGIEENTIQLKKIAENTQNNNKGGSVPIIRK